MEERLEDSHKENKVEYESFDTDDSQKLHNKKKKNYIPIISIFGFLLIFIVIFLYLSDAKLPKKEPEYELVKETQCLTFSKDKK